MGLSRRQFTREFKLAAVRRLEAGVSLAEVARGWKSARMYWTVGGVSSGRRPAMRFQATGSRAGPKHVECCNFRGGRICRQIENRHAPVVTKRIRYVNPVENMPRLPQRFNAMLRCFVIIVPGHCR